MLAMPGIATSNDAHSAAASLEAGSIARFATRANSTRSTSVVNRRAPSTLRSALPTPSWRHNPSSRCAVPIGLDPATVSPSPTSSATSAGRVAVGQAEVAVDRRDQPHQPVSVQGVLAAQADQHLRLGHSVDAAVVRQLHVAHEAAVLVPALGRPQVHAHHPTAPAKAGSRTTRPVVCPRISSIPGPRQRPEQHQRASEPAHAPINCGTRVTHPQDDQCAADAEALP